MDWFNLAQDGKELWDLTFGSHKMREISRLAEKIEILQGRICSLDFANYGLEYKAFHNLTFSVFLWL